MKVALVTGATGGIGRFLVDGLIGMGYHVVGVGRSEAKLRDVTESDNFSYIVADLREPGAPMRVLEEFQNMGFQRLGLLVNNAGFAIRKPLLEHDSDELRDVFQVNTVAPVDLTVKFTPVMPQGSTVVFVISGVAFINVPELPSYCSAKGALHYLAVNLERELKDREINVMRVYPQHVRTGFWGEKVPKGAVEPEKVARVILNGLKTGRREVFVPSYMRIVEYLPNWPVFTYRFKY